MLSKLNSCGCNARFPVTRNYQDPMKPINDIIDKTTGYTNKYLKEEIAKLKLLAFDPITLALVAAGVVAVVFVGAFGAGLALGIVGSGKKDKKQITTIINTTMTNSLKETVNSDIRQEDTIKKYSANNININAVRCEVIIDRTDQNIRTIASRIAVMDANVKTEFNTKLLTEFIANVQTEMKNVTDPITKLAEALKEKEETITTEINKDFKNTIERIKNINYRQASHFDLGSANTINLICVDSKINYGSSVQNIYDEISSKAYAKIFDETISNSNFVNKAVIEARSSQSEFSTGFIIAIVAIILILIALYAYFFLF